MEANSLEGKLQLLHIEYNRKKRKLKKSRRSSEARAYVQQKLQEVSGQVKFGCHHETEDADKIQKDVISVPTPQVFAGKPDRKSELQETENEDKFLSPGNFETNTSKETVRTNLKHAIADEKHIDLNTGSAEENNDVVIMSPLVQVGGKQREKRLKLTKYRTKNFVNPLRDDLNLSANLGAEKALLSVSGNSVNSGDVNVGNEDKKDKDCNDGAPAYSKGEALVVERKIEQSEHETDKIISKMGSDSNGLVKSLIPTHPNDSKDPVKSLIPTHFKCDDSNRFEDSHSGNSQKFGKGDELMDVTNCDRTNVRRRSGGRKRRISGVEGPQRRSSRLSNISSQESTSSNETCISPPSVSTIKHCTNKSIILSSVFQCLVDEGKRQPQSEFSIKHSDEPIHSEGKRKIGTEISIKLGDKGKIQPQTENNIKIGEPVSSEPIHSEPVSSEEKSAGKTSETDSEDLFEPKYGTELNKCNTEDTISGTEANKLNSVDSDSTTVNDVLEKCNGADDQTDSGRVNVPDIPGINVESCSVEDDKDSEMEEVRSPTLFESQAFIIEPLESCGNSEKTLNYSDKSAIESQPCSMPATEQIIEDESIASRLHLKPFSNFQVPNNEHIHSVCCGEVTLDDRDQLFVVCLCSTCLKLYTHNGDNMWTTVASTKIPFTIRKKSGNVMFALNDTETVSIVLLEPKTNCTVIYCYSYHGNTWHHSTVDKIFCKSLHICPLPDMKMVVSYYTEKKTYLDKYSVDTTSEYTWSHVQLGCTDSHVIELVCVAGLQSALVALTESAEIQIWNHDQGFCLTTIDISHVCPVKPLCPQVYSEQGFLFVPIISGKKGSEAGSVIVVNPYLGTSETLNPINVENTWTGTSKVSMMSENLILCRQNNGCIRIWNVYTGHIVASLDDVTVSTMYSKDKFLVVAHKQCVHTYMLNIPHESTI